MVTWLIRRQRVYLGLTAVALIGILGCTDPTRTGGVSVEPLPPITVTIVPEGTFPISPTDPTAIVIPASSMVQFHAVTIQGTRVDQLVKWVVYERYPNLPTGTISQLGLFQAPPTASQITVGGGKLEGLTQTYSGSLHVEIKP